MGFSFSNIHIKKTDSLSREKISDIFREFLKEKGYTETNDKNDSECTLVIADPQGAYFSVSCEAIEFGGAEDMKSTALLFSEKTGSDVIAACCEDSDYLMLCYENLSTDADGWINIGRPYGTKLPRRTSLSAWKALTDNNAKLKEIVKAEYVFAEEAFREIAALIGMDSGACCIDSDYESGEKLYFKLPDNVERELPKFKIWLFGGDPCRMDEPNCVHAVNIGGRGKGAAVIVTGDFIENDELVLENVLFESDLLSTKYKAVPITFEKRRTSSGDMMLYWEDKTFNIPQRVNPGLSDIKQLDLEGKRSFGIRFGLKGDPRKRFGIKVFIVPLDNYQNGGDCWFYDRYC